MLALTPSFIRSHPCPLLAACSHRSDQQTQGTQSPTHEPATNPLGSSSVSGETSKGLSGQEQRGEGQQGKKQEGGVSAEAIAVSWDFSYYYGGGLGLHFVSFFPPDIPPNAISVKNTLARFISRTKRKNRAIHGD